MPKAVPPKRLGVVGAGSMGAGIAQLGCLAGMETVLYDITSEALEAGVARLQTGLRKGAERGLWSADKAAAAAARLVPATDFEALRDCELIVEAVPEQLELKRDVFRRLSALGDEIVLATNTSSLMVAAIASAASRPERVVGMHFFNPPPLMRLVEIVAGPDSSEETVATARAVAEAMKRRPIDTLDRPGFLVNRCLRPFYLEALRLLDEGVASVEQIDRVARLGGGFRIGPFELMDLVGIDVNFEVAKSFYDQSFGEPRWRPSPTQARMTAMGRHGRKTGRGYYDYGGDEYRPPDPKPPAPGGGDGTPIVVLGAGTVARELRDRAQAAGYHVHARSNGVKPELVVDARVPSPTADTGVAAAPLLVLCADRSLTARQTPTACGFHVLPPLQSTQLVELASLPTTPAATAGAAEEFFHNLGFLTEWIRDAPGLVLSRLVCQTINEAAFAIGEGVASAEDVDVGLVLGLNHPRGPVEWAELIGLDHVLATIDGLWNERREERYRAAPLLRQAGVAGGSLAVASPGANSRAAGASEVVKTPARR